MREGWVGGLGLAIQTKVCIGRINSKVLRYRTGSYIQCPLINHRGKNMKKNIQAEYMYIYM